MEELKKARQRQQEEEKEEPDIGSLKTVRLPDRSEEQRLREMVNELQEEIEIMRQRHENSRRISSVTGQEKKVHNDILRSLEDENRDLKRQLQEAQARHDVERRVAAKRGAELMNEGIELRKELKELREQLAAMPSPIRHMPEPANTSTTIDGDERLALRSMLEMMQTTLAVEKQRLHSRINQSF